MEDHLTSDDFLIKINLFEKQMNCSHSFNDNDRCEYCGLDSMEFDQSSAAGEPIGVYE